MKSVHLLAYSWDNAKKVETTWDSGQLPTTYQARTVAHTRQQLQTLLLCKDAPQQGESLPLPRRALRPDTDSECGEATTAGACRVS